MDASARSGACQASCLMQPELQDKPGILVSNYGNFFFDDMIGAMVGPVWSRIADESSSVIAKPARIAARWASIVGSSVRIRASAASK